MPILAKIQDCRMSAPRKLTRFTQQEIDQTFKNARSALAQSGIQILLAPKQKELGRILVIASSKTGNAVERNKFKRQIRSIFREEKLFELPYDCIIIAKKKLSTFSFADLQEFLRKAYKINQ